MASLATARRDPVRFKINPAASKKFRQSTEGQKLVQRGVRAPARADSMLGMLGGRPKMLEDDAFVQDILSSTPKKKKKSSSKKADMSAADLLRSLELDTLKAKARARRGPPSIQTYRNMPVMQTFPVNTPVKKSKAKKPKQPKQPPKPKKQIVKGQLTPRALNILRDIKGDGDKKAMNMEVRKELCRRIGAIRKYVRKKK